MWTNLAIFAPARVLLVFPSFFCWASRPMLRYFLGILVRSFVRYVLPILGTGTVISCNLRCSLNTSCSLYLNLMVPPVLVQKVSSMFKNAQHMSLSVFISCALIRDYMSYYRPVCQSLDFRWTSLEHMQDLNPAILKNSISYLLGNIIFVGISVVLIIMVEERDWMMALASLKQKRNSWDHEIIWKNSPLYSTTCKQAAYLLNQKW